MTDTARLEDLRRRVQSDPSSIAFAALAEEYRRAGRFDDAIATCRVGLQRHPAYLSARVTLGRALLEVGEHATAREELEQVLRSAPENLAAIRGLIEIHERTGEAMEELERYRQLLEPPGRNPRTLRPAAGPSPETSGRPERVIAVTVAAPLPSTESSPPTPPIDSGPDGRERQIADLQQFLDAVRSARR